MKAKFIEGADNELGVMFDAETDEERMLLRVFSGQAERHGNLIRLSGWGLGGPHPGVRYLRFYFSKADDPSTLDR